MIKLIEVYTYNNEDTHMHSTIANKYIVMAIDNGYNDYYEFNAKELTTIQHDLFYNYMFNNNIKNFIQFLYDEFGIRINGKHRTLKSIWALNRGNY